MSRARATIWKVSITIRRLTLERLRRRVVLYKRSQFLDYAACAMLERVAGRVREAEDYERMARELVRS